MEIHKEYCPIYLESIGRYNSTGEAYCNCHDYTKFNRSSPQVEPKELPKIEKSQQLNIIWVNDDLYVIKDGKLIKVNEPSFPYFYFTLDDLKRYVLENGEIIETHK